MNVEGDGDARHGAAQYSTPSTPTGEWDDWSQRYGYPYRGQPSVVFDVVIELPPRHRFAPATFVARTPSRMGALDGSLRSSALDGIVDDPVAHPGSGADRLRLVDGARVQVEVRQVCR